MGPSPSRVAVVVLAAGTSTRMSRAKQLLQWKEKTLVQHVVDAAAASCADEVVVVLGRASHEVERSLDLPAHAHVAHNPRFALGQASSLRVGLEACSSACEASVIVLGDQPQLTADLIDRVIERWRNGGRPIVRYVYDGIPGHPVLLARPIWEELPATGDEGARALIADRPEIVDNIVLPHPPPLDVDTPEDFRALE